MKTIPIIFLYMSSQYSFSLDYHSHPTIPSLRARRLQGTLQDRCTEHIYLSLLYLNTILKFAWHTFIKTAVCFPYIRRLEYDKSNVSSLVFFYFIFHFNSMALRFELLLVFWSENCSIIVSTTYVYRWIWHFKIFYSRSF